MLNFDIPPNGYIYILSTSILNNMAIKKCPSSWKTINEEIIINGMKDAVKIATIAKR